MHFTSASSLALVALATDARAHMILHSPVPYGNPTDNSPLKPAEFPCRMSNGFAITQMNTVAAGGSLPFSFMGTTVHTGGSCQFSVTTDVPPTTNSQWKVIHSAVGGCVSNYTNNFAPASPSALGDAHVYDIAFPKQLQSGQYSAAWTWINKAAEAPEFYMNCAPVTVTGGSSDASFLAGLPDMFVANLGSPAASCSTPSQGGDFVFPEPGDSVETESVTPLVPVSGVTGAGCATMTKLGAGAGSMGAPASASASASASPVSSASYGAGSQSASAPSASAPAQTTAASSAAASQGYSAAPSSAQAASAVTAAAAASPSPSLSGVNAVPCPENGAVVCIGSNQFGLCNFGWAVVQNLAAGALCPNATAPTVTPAAHARHVRHFPPHARRHGSSLF